MSSTTRPKTKAAMDLKPGDWCDFGSLSWRVGDVQMEDTMVLVFWGDQAIPSEFCHDEQIRMHYDD